MASVGGCGPLTLLRITVNNACVGVEPWKLIAYTAAALYSTHYACQLVENRTEIIQWLRQRFFDCVKLVPSVKKEIAKQTSDVNKALSESFARASEGIEGVFSLPAQGMTEDEVKSKVSQLQGLTEHYERGILSGVVYNGGADVSRVVMQAYSAFCWANPLHPEVFPGVRVMEAEVVQMCVDMFHGTPHTCGTMTTGGTESLLMACKTYRDWGLKVKGIRKPNMVIPDSAHAAFDKAGSYFHIKVVRVPVDPTTFKADVTAMRKACDRNTVMLVGSAPGFPHGIVDDITAIAKVGKKRNIGVHVDSCLGGFLLPFMTEAGLEIEPFDFSVEGVTSISCDTHKYGCGPKGASVIMYRSNELRRHQYFSAPDWSGGLYASPSILGSRPGALIAATWAVMMWMGRQGYVENTRKIVDKALYIKAKLRAIPHIKVLGDPHVSVVAFSSDDFDVYRLAGILGASGWQLNNMQSPPSIHICLTTIHTQEGVCEKFVSDVEAAVVEVMKNPTQKAEGVGAMYGMAATVPDRSLVSDMAETWLDMVYTVTPGK